MYEFLIEPEKFQEEVDNLSTAKETVSDELLKIETEGLELETINKLKEVVTKLNAVINSYKGLLAQDVKNLETIKLEWMAVDSNLAAVHLQGPTFNNTQKPTKLAPGPIGKGHSIS